MSVVTQVLEQIARTADCVVSPPRGQPILREGDVLPDDLTEFYELAGGVDLFAYSAYSMSIVGPEQFVRANPVIVGAEVQGDISDAWYIVARGGAEEAISIDTSRGRLGRCYDSFWDRHGVRGDSRIVALSFSELLRRLFEARGGYWYWLADDRPNYGDAYDPVRTLP